MDTADDPESPLRIKDAITELMNFEGEDLPYKTISQRNLKEIIDNTNELVHLICNFKSDDHLIKEGVNITDNFNSNEESIREKQTQLVILKEKYVNRKQSVSHLESLLKKSKNQLEKLKEANKIDEKNRQSALELFGKVLENYKLYFGYDIKIEDKSGKSRYTIIINFKLDDGTLSHPIKFTFDKTNDTLLDFNASDMMTTKQKKLHFNNFKITNNYLAFFYALRSCAIKQNEK